MESNHFVYVNKHLHINKTHFQTFRRFSFLFKAHPRLFFRHLAQIVQVADGSKKRVWRDEAGEWIVGERSLIEAFTFFERKTLEFRKSERFETLERSTNKQAIAAASSTVESPDWQLESCDEICGARRVGVFISSLELVGQMGKFPVE